MRLRDKRLTPRESGCPHFRVGSHEELRPALEESRYLDGRSAWELSLFKKGFQGVKLGHARYQMTRINRTNVVRALDVCNCKSNRPGRVNDQTIGDMESRQ